MINLDNIQAISAKMRGDVIPMKLDRKGVYVLDLAQYQKMYPQPRGPIHFDTFDSIRKLFRFHTVESVMADILQERVSEPFHYNTPSGFLYEFDEMLERIRRLGKQRIYTQ